jgi:hypothetical protein
MNDSYWTPMEASRKKTSHMFLAVHDKVKGRIFSR